MILKNKHFFITGIGTDVGKSVISSILVTALNADYWKPVQAGEIELGGDSKRVMDLSTTTGTFHKPCYEFKLAASPHLAAAKENRALNGSSIHRPSTPNHLVIEGAGGPLVPINSTELIIDLSKPTDIVIVVSKHYLGSIHHTLSTIEAIKSRGLQPVVVFVGESTPSTEQAITNHSGAPVLGRIDWHKKLNKELILDYAVNWKSKIEAL